MLLSCVCRTWLTFFQSSLSRYVAIKVCTAVQENRLKKEGASSEHDDEASVLQRLAQGPADHAGKMHVVNLLDRFELVGPNGQHICLVMELLGPRLRWGCGPDLEDEIGRVTAWKISKQLVEATAYMHSLGITHGGAY